VALCYRRKCDFRHLRAVYAEHASGAAPAPGAGA
jgi:hypothetical protein